MSNIFTTNAPRLCQEGSLFSCTNITPGTVVNTATPPPQALVATTPLFVIKNNAPATASTRVTLLSLNVQQFGTVPASVLSVQSAIVIDTGDRTPTAASSSSLTPVNSVIGGKTSTTLVWSCLSGQTLTVPAAVAAKTISRRQVKGGPIINLDEYEFRFGADTQSTKTPPSAVGMFSCSVPSVCLLPQQFALIYIWFPTGITNPFAHEFDLTFSER